MRQMEQLPLGDSATSMVVCTTLRALGPRGDVTSRVGARAGWPAARASEDSWGGDRRGLRVEGFHAYSRSLVQRLFFGKAQLETWQKQQPLSTACTAAHMLPCCCTLAAAPALLHARHQAGNLDINCFPEVHKQADSKAAVSPEPWTSVHSAAAAPVLAGCHTSSGSHRPITQHSPGDSTEGC